MHKIFWVLLLCQVAIATDHSRIPNHELTAAEKLQTLLQNRGAESRLDNRRTSIEVHRPFAEYEKARFVLFNDEFSLGVRTIKETIAANLPKDMKLILLARSKKSAETAKAHFEKIIDADRLVVHEVPKGETFWARDTTPVPVFLDEAKTLGLVDTEHRGGKFIAPKILELFSVPLVESEFNYPGGNFMADTRGNCFQVESERGFLPEAALRTMYGCKHVTTFPHQHGLGDIDEVVKVVSESVALVDEPAYDATMEELGYQVVRLPRPSGNPRGTYVNSLQVNGTVFLPVYGVPEDDEAIKAYRSQGLKVFPLPSNDVSQTGFGSIHCMTMAYP